MATAGADRALAGRDLARWPVGARELRCSCCRAAELSVHEPDRLPVVDPR
ncbi:MAG: hypothetical protein KDB71_07485 [Mycobacterium sp.]|nr:hypothetical protein [Mycobacterium sp.]